MHKKGINDIGVCINICIELIEKIRSEEDLQNICAEIMEKHSELFDPLHFTPSAIEKEILIENGPKNTYFLLKNWWNRLLNGMNKLRMK